MTRTLLALVYAAAATAQIQMSGISALPTGVIIYATGDPAGCTIEVSDTADFAALVAAVDDGKGGRSSCDGGERPSRGRSMQIVVGGPGIVTAPDGRKYSKALKPFSQYFYRIRQNGTPVTTGVFITANHPFGNMRTDPPLADPSLPGEYAYPTIDQGATDWRTTDPSTGLLYTKLTRAGTKGAVVGTDVPFAAAGGAWANPANALADDAAAAVINGDSQATLFLLHDQVGHSLGAADYADRNSVDYYQVKLKASGTAGAAADRTIQVALSADRATAFTPWRDVVLGTTEGMSVVGTTTPIDLWQAPGGRALARPDMARRSGTVNVAGPVVTYATGDRFNILWGSGSKITINGSEYTVASVEHEMQLTLTAPAGNQAGAPYTAANFGVLIRKKTPSADTVSVQYAAATYQTSDATGWPPGGFNICSPVLKTAADGKQGANCFIGASLYFVPVDGSGMRFLGDVYADSSGQWPYDEAPGMVPCTAFDLRDPDYVWCTQLGFNGRLLWRRGHYNGDHQFHSGITALPYCASNGNTQPCSEWLNLTPATSGKDLLSMMKEYGGYPATFPFPPYCSFGGIQRTAGDTIALGVQCVFIQNSTALFYVFDAGNELPLGTPGSTVRLSAYSDTFSRPARRWASSHSWWLSDNPDDAGWDVFTWHALGPFATTTAGYGPYTVTAVSVDGRPGANLTATLSSCPANSLHPGLAGQLKCTTVVLNRAAPCDDDPNPAIETPMIALNPALHAAKCGGSGKYYLQDAIEGDFVIAQDNTWEAMEILKITGTTWVLHRGDFYDLSAMQTKAAVDHSTNVLAMAPNIPDYARAIMSGHHSWYWPGDPYHTSAATDTWHNLRGNDSGGHESIFRNVELALGECGEAYGFYNVCYVARIGGTSHRMTGATWDRTFANNPPVSGQPVFAFPNTVDTHPVLGPATGNSEMFALDGRPFTGSEFTPARTGTLVGGQLYKFVAADFTTYTSHVLKRKLFDTIAYVGVNPLQDVSSAAAGNVVGTGASDSYKYCYAEKPNECRTGSSAGDVYVNAPQVRLRGCSFDGIAVMPAETRNICIFNNQPHAHRYLQYLLRSDYLGRYSRPLGSGLQLYSRFDVYMNMSSTPDGRYGLFRTPFAGWVRSDAFSVEIPPIETDSVNRTEFVPVSAGIRALNGADNAIVEFGYSRPASPGADANGNPDEFLYCTTRREKCVLASGTTGTNPFYFESETYSGIPCGSGCEAAIPAVPGRVLYYRVVHRAGTRVIARGGLKAVAVP